MSQFHAAVFVLGYEPATSDTSDEESSSSTESVYSIGEISVISDCDNKNDLVISGCESENDDEEEKEGDSIENQPLESYIAVVQSPSKGYVLCIGNVDMNVRRNFQRISRTTKSYHFCHSYTAKNRVDSSKLPDGLPTGELSPDNILPCKNDVNMILKDFEILISR